MSENGLETGPLQTNGHAKSDHLEVVPLIINGKSVTATPSLKFPVYGFELGRDVLLAESADTIVANLAAEASLTTFNEVWKKTSALSRRRILLRYADLLRQHEPELVEAQRLETSVIEMWAHKNVHFAADLVEEIAACITQLQGQIPQTQTPEDLALAFVQPIGPVLSIVPWNSSIILGARALATPVAAGCTVILKASELCPKTHSLLVKIFVEAGLPDGVINTVQVRREDAAKVTEALIAHPAIRKVEFIGSAPVGKLIGQLGGKYMKPVLMECGGKGPAVVLEDADLDDAAMKCVIGALTHHGQLCFSTERVIVIESVAAKFQEIVIKKAAGFPTGNGISPRIVDASLEKLQDAEKKGAHFILGGAERASKSALKPTILTGVTKDMTIFDEEAFGPSFSLYIAKDDADAVKIANQTQYGLNAAVHSSNMEHAIRVAKELDTATVHINGATAYDEPTLPIGGIKGSGWGHNNALWGLKEFSHIKLVTVQSKVKQFV